jgi:hypothetical protein
MPGTHLIEESERGHLARRCWKRAGRPRSGMGRRRLARKPGLVCWVFLSTISSVPIPFGTIIAAFIAYFQGGVARSMTARMIFGMVGKQREDVRDEDVTRLPYSDSLTPLTLAASVV